MVGRQKNDRCVCGGITGLYVDKKTIILILSGQNLVFLHVQTCQAKIPPSKLSTIERGDIEYFSPKHQRKEKVSKVDSCSRESLPLGE